MKTKTPPNSIQATKTRLDAARATINGCRDDLAAARKARDTLRAKVTSASGPLSQAELKAAEKAVGEIQAGEEQLAAAQSEERALLALLPDGGGHAFGRSGNGSQDPDPMVGQLAEEDGAWLGAVLANAAPTVPTAIDRLKATAGPMALEGALDTGEAGSVETSRVVVELVRPRSALAAAGVPILGIGSTETKVPWVKARPEAAWRKEGEAFKKGAPTVEMVPVEPGSCGLVSPLSIEVYDDISAPALAAVQRQIVTAVAVEVDRGLVQGDGEDPEPTGILTTSEIGAQEGDLESLDVFVQGIGALVTQERNPAACLIHPTDVTTLGLVREFGGETVSNKPLVGIGAAFTSPLLPSVTFYATKATPEGTGVLFDPNSLAIVLRKSADLSIDPFYDFDNGLIALRVYVRADILVDPAGVCALEFAGS